jgi:benzoylformate decarboxylase
VQLVDNPAMAARAATGVSIVTDLKLGVRALLDGPAPAPRSAPRPLQRPPRLTGMPFTDSYLMQEIAALRPKNSVIVEEAPSTRGPMHDYLPILEKDGFHTCASGGLGHGLPAAVGIAMGRTDRLVIAILGDGSSMYSIQGLWSAAQLGLRIAFIIVKNGGYIALNEFGLLFDIANPPGTSLPQLDFCGLAESQGVRAIRVERAADLGAALTEAFKTTRPILVEVVVDGAEDVRPGEA